MHQTERVNMNRTVLDKVRIIVCKDGLVKVDGDRCWSDNMRMDSSANLIANMYRERIELKNMRTNTVRYLIMDTKPCVVYDMLKYVAENEIQGVAEYTAVIAAKTLTTLRNVRMSMNTNTDMKTDLMTIMNLITTMIT